MRMRKANLWLPTALLLICLAFGVLIYQQLTMAPDSEAFARSSTERDVELPDLPPPPQFSMMGIENYQAVLERPLFSPDRRPPPGDSTTPTVSKEFDFDLKGVVIEDNVRTALLRRQIDGQIVRLARGDEIEGWTLLEVELDYVVVEHDGHEEVLELTFDAPSSTDTAAKQDKAKE
jgi:type II secretory pathway component PulC